MNVEKITWNDHSYSHSDQWWEEAELVREAAKPFAITTYGVVVAETEDVVVLATDLDTSGRCRYWYRIIKALILERETFHRYEKSPSATAPDDTFPSQDGKEP